MKWYKSLYIYVHVDDFGIVATNNDIINNIKHELQHTYKITINDNLEYYLDMLI